MQRLRTAPALALILGLCARIDAAETSRPDHVGLPVPDYTTGEECLFCHRDDVGPAWQQTSHAWTTRPADQPPAVENLPSDATHIVGGINAYMPLKQVGYGRFALYSAKSKTWQTGSFEKECAGCHTTAVDPKSLAFASSGLDCVTCHGLVPSEHTTNGALVWLGKKHSGTVRLKESICAQCHLRGGKSLSTGRPYPNNFFAGDDLLTDFRVNLNNDAGLDKNDTHSYVKTRLILEGNSERTCVDCHKIHTPPASRRRDPALHSTVCGY